MAHQKAREVILEIISNIAPDEDLSNIRSDIPLKDQVDLDSMDFLDIVMELRKKHNIEVPEADYPRLASLDSCAEYLGPRFAQKI